MAYERPRLTPVPVSLVWPPRPGQLTACMERGEWSILFSVFYEVGWVLIEVDEENQILHAYQKRPRPMLSP